MADVSGIVHFSGAISGGTSGVAFTLPPGFRPATMVYVPVDLCDAHNGRLEIFPSGVVDVQPEGTFNQATCFTSLDGASFAQSASGFTPLALKNGWKNAPYSTSKAAARVISGIVHLKGAITGGASGFAFTLPPGFRPATNVYVPADLCNARNGRLDIHPNGAVSVEAEGGAFHQARCFTSLDGASFAKSASGFTALALQNGWQNAPIGTSQAAVRLVSGIVQFKGAIAGGANGVVFTLPHGFRPATDVYIPVDLSGGGKGRLDISPFGVVTLEAEGGYQQAQQFTSLDGASFKPGVFYATYR